MDNEIIKSTLSSVENIFSSILQFAEGSNPEGRNFFEEMEADPAFKKSFQNFEKSQKEKGLSDLEIVQAQIMNLMLNDDTYFQGAGKYSYFDDDMFRSSDLLRKAGQTEAPRLIKNHRRLQLSQFGRIAEKDKQGIKIVHKDSEYKPAEKELKNMKKWTDIIANQFFFMPGETKPNLGRFLGAAYEDFFDLDKIAIFIRRTKDGKRPLGMILTDAALIKTIVPRTYNPMRWDSDELEAIEKDAGLQKIDEFYQDEYRYILINQRRTRIAKFTERAMIVSHFFKRSATDDLFKGNSIIEQAVKTVTSIMNSIELNASRMTNNRVPAGIIALQGGANVNQMQVEKFKRLLWAQTMGAENRWRVPIIALPEKNQVQWLPFHDNNKDMEFFNWMSLLFTILCRLSGTDPEELSLASNKGAIEGKGALFQQGQEGLNRRSRDTGLRTFLDYIAEIINDSGVLKELIGHADWIVKFSGLDVRDERESEELNSKMLTTHASLNDILSQEGKKPYKMEFGDINLYDVPGILSQNVFQALQMKIQEQQMQEQQEQQAQMGQMGAPEAEGMEGAAPDQEMPAGAAGGAQEGENNQLPELSDEDLKLLQEYGISQGNQEDEAAAEKAIKLLTMKKSTMAKPNDLIEIIIEE